MEYQTCGRRCDLHCFPDEADDFRDCERDCVEGCHCPEGTVLHDGEGGGGAGGAGRGGEER